MKEVNRCLYGNRITSDCSILKSIAGSFIGYSRPLSDRSLFRHVASCTHMYPRMRRVVLYIGVRIYAAVARAVYNSAPPARQTDVA